jgi:sugar lactone lactonase YvrE
MDADLIRAVSPPCLLGESPMWHPREQVLYWCDIPGRRLHRLDPASGQTQHWDFPVEPASVAPALDGTLRLAMRDGLWRHRAFQRRQVRSAGALLDRHDLRAARSTAGGAVLLGW